MAQQILDRVPPNQPAPARTRNASGRLRRLPWPVVLLTAVLVVLVALPILVLFVASFIKDSTPGTFDGEFTLDN